jgi:hypothetical protein
MNSATNFEGYSPIFVRSPVCSLRRGKEPIVSALSSDSIDKQRLHQKGNNTSVLLPRRRFGSKSPWN